jgi:DNA-binding NarL/FixJ family response regulator
MSIRIVIADDHEVVRTGLVSLLEGTDVHVVAQAAGGEEALRLVREHRPDVLLLDIRMAEGDGLSILEGVRHQSAQTKVVILSTYDNPTYIARAQALGASDYLLKGCTRDELLGAIQAVAAGQAPSPFGELHRVAGTMADREREVGEDVALTHREAQVLRHVALGLSNKEIARSLSISVETVKEHVQRVLKKINAADRTQAAVWAVRKGLV